MDKKKIAEIHRKEYTRGYDGYIRQRAFFRGEQKGQEAEREAISKALSEVDTASVAKLVEAFRPITDLFKSIDDIKRLAHAMGRVEFLLSVPREDIKGGPFPSHGPFYAWKLVEEDNQGRVVLKVFVYGDSLRREDTDKALGYAVTCTHVKPLEAYTEAGERITDRDTFRGGDYVLGREMLFSYDNDKVDGCYLFAHVGRLYDEFKLNGGVVPDSLLC